MRHIIVILLLLSCSCYKIVYCESISSLVDKYKIIRVRTNKFGVKRALVYYDYKRTKRISKQLPGQ